MVVMIMSLTSTILVTLIICIISTTSFILSIVINKISSITITFIMTDAIVNINMMIS